MSIETAFCLILLMVFVVTFILDLEYRGCKYEKSLESNQEEFETSSNQKRKDLLVGWSDAGNRL